MGFGVPASLVTDGRRCVGGRWGVIAGICDGMDLTMDAGHRFGVGTGKAALLIVVLGALALAFASPARAAGMLTITAVEPPAGGASGSPPLTGPRPTIVGSTTEPLQSVHVKVLEGETVVFPNLEATPGAEGAWSVSVPPVEPLQNGRTYTAVAEQEEGLTVTVSPSFVFEVSTAEPEVTLAEPAHRVGRTIPAFTGNGSEAGTRVVVHVRNGSEEPVDAGETTVAKGGSWSAVLENALPEGSYTVEATEESALGNPEGHSTAWPIEVSTKAPTVTIEGLPARTGSTSPTFSGKGSEEGTEVLVTVKRGTEELAKGKTTVGAGGKWSTGLDKALPKGDYEATVTAVEASALAGNSAGEAGPEGFEIVTAAPTVMLVEPPKRSNRQSPTFSGEAEAGGEVLVHVLRAGTTEEIDKGNATVGSGGGWSAGLEKPLDNGEYSYTVFATEASTVLGDEEIGESAHYGVELDTEAPKLSLTEPTKRSNSQSPTFSGTGEAGGGVLVHVLRAGTNEEIGKGKATVAAGGGWSAGLEALLASGEYSYTVYATETSALSGNPSSESSHYNVELDTEAPRVSLDEPPTRSSETSPTFAGTGEASGQVIVHVLRAGSSEEIGKGKATVGSGGGWSAGLEAVLPKGEYSYVVFATEASTLTGDPKGESHHWTVELDTAGPVLTLIKPPATRTNELSPTFSGTSNEEGGEVLVHVVRAGTSDEIGKGKATVAGETWSARLEAPLPSGEYSYTVYATETSLLSGDAKSESKHWTVELDTQPPTVTLNKPPARTSEVTPTFSGAGSEEGGEVVVEVLEGKTVVSEGRTVVLAGGTWSASVGTPLPDGDHKDTVEAFEVSLLKGNGEGKSKAWPMEVDTNAPNVTLEEPAKRSNNLKPKFSGTGSEEGTEVVVTVKRGTEELAKGRTTVGSGGKWSTGLEKALPEGEYRASVVAVETSGLGNKAGEAEAGFEIDTKPPEVSIEAPAKRSNNLKPKFSGTGGEEGAEVIVRVVNAENKEIGTGKTTVAGGQWSTGPEKELPPGEYKATVVAEETSGLGNEKGKTEPVGFEVDTLAPKLMLEAPKRTGNVNPSFSGSGEAGAEIVVRVKKGSEEASGRTKVGSGGKWSTGLEAALPTGDYDASVSVKETSALAGNPPAEAGPDSFEVDTEAPNVTLEEPAKRSSALKPKFSGTGSEEGTEVVVRVMEGTKELAKGRTTVGSGGKWSTGLETELPKGEYRASVVAAETSGLGNSPGKAEAGFEIDTEAPKVAIEAPAKRSSALKPKFSGTGSEEGTIVTVHVFKANHEELGTGKTTVTGGKWSTGLENELPKGEYGATVVVEEASALSGNGNGHTEAGFEIDTEAPRLVLGSLPEVSSNTTPTFAGTSNESPQVTVHVYKEDTVVQTLTTQVKEGVYEATSGSALPNGVYTATAEQPSGLEGNPAATTHPAVQFEINTNAPGVEITEKPPAESNNLTPKFAGTVKAPESGKRKVKLEVHEGSLQAPIVFAAEASVEGGRWGSVTLPAGALRAGRHTYTALASTESAIGNEIGKSAPWTFVVDTEAPSVQLNQPPSPSNELSPTFSGTASEEGEVVVHVMEGATEVAKASEHTSHGEWSATLAKPLPEGEHQFAAYAEEKSGIGNKEGRSTQWAFTVDTLAPVIDVTQAPQATSSERRPFFGGTASDHTEVTLEIHAGNVEGAVVSKIAGKVEDGEWFAQQQEQLEFGEYTAVVTQPSSITRNPTGQSKPITFTIAQIAPVGMTEEAGEINETHVALYGSVNPQGGPISSCVFEIGPTTAYGKQVGCGFVGNLRTFPPAAMGAIAVFVRVYALAPNTTYHERVVAVGEGGVGVGVDRTFTTLPEEVRHISIPTGPLPVHSTGNVLGTLAENLPPSGPEARIGALLRHGGYRERFKAPEAGTLTIEWYQVRHGQKIGGTGKHAPTLVATGRVVTKAAGTVTLSIRLTAAGRKLLRNTKRITLSDACTFTPAGGGPVTSTGTFQLKR
jgi:large repetitive protein